MDGFDKLGTRNANVESRSENCQGESVLYVNRRTYDLSSYNNNYVLVCWSVQVLIDTLSNVKKKKRVIVRLNLPFGSMNCIQWD